MRIGLLLAAIFLFFVGVANVSAGVTQVTGPGLLVVNPANQRYYPDPYGINQMFYWPEQTGYTLGSDLVVSILPPVTFPTDSTTHSFDLSLKVAAGTVIDSYLLNYDPQGGSISAQFHFDHPILGLITNSVDAIPANDHFILSDYLINPAVPVANIPAAHFDARGIEPVSGDHVRWISATDIEVDIGASTPGDQIRVITASSEVPEPGSLAMLAAGMGLVASRRWGRQNVR